MIIEFEIFEKFKMEVEYHCHECNWKGWLPMSKIVTCPNCGNINDIWKEGESIPKRHKRMNKQ